MEHPEDLQRDVFDRLTALAAHALNVPVALATIVDARRQFLLSERGIGEPWHSRRETPLTHSVCRYVVETGQELALDDVRSDARVAGGPVEIELGLLSYLGCPVRTNSGAAVGAFAVADVKPRAWTEGERAVLRDLAAVATHEISRGRIALTADALLDRSSDALVAIDDDSRITFLNPAAARMFGVKAADALNRPLAELLGEEPKVVSEARRTRAAESIAEIDLASGDRKRHVEVRVYPSPLGLVLILRDVTERHAAFVRLQESEERFRTLFEIDPNLAFTVGFDGRVESVNAAAVEVTGFSREELLSMRFQDVIAPEDLARAMEIFGGALQGTPQRYELRIVHKSGRKIEMRGASAPLIYGGRIRGAYGVAEDVTQRKLVDEQLRVAQRLESVARLAGTVAHDFNNVLMTIRTVADLLAGDPSLSPTARDDAREILAATARAELMTRQLLSLSRRDPPKPTRILIADEVRRMARVLSVAFAPNVTVRVEGDGTSPEVLLDAAQLEQIVMNLARNARDAMPSGTLTITTATDGPACAITVADTGCGFSPDARAHAFEPFFTTKPEGKGTGLGLATVHRIVTAAGGTIQLDSRPGTGTRIKISLPRL